MNRLGFVVGPATLGYWRSKKPRSSRNAPDQQVARRHSAESSSRPRGHPCRRSGREAFGRRRPCRRPFGSFSVVAPDLNGDGRQDVAVASREGAGSLATWHGLADWSFRAAGRYEIASGPTTSAAADLTGDGSAKVLVGGNTPVFQRIEIVGSPSGLATGDVDDDGRLDRAVPNDAANYVSVFLTRSGLRNRILLDLRIFGDHGIH